MKIRAVMWALGVAVAACDGQRPPAVCFRLDAGPRTAVATLVPLGNAPYTSPQAITTTATRFHCVVGTESALCHSAERFALSDGVHYAMTLHIERTDAGHRLSIVGASRVVPGRNDYVGGSINPGSAVEMTFDAIDAGTINGFGCGDQTFDDPQRRPAGVVMLDRVPFIQVAR